MCSMFRKTICLVSFVLLLGLVLTSVAEAVDPDLFGWWKLDEGSGDTASDSSGNGFDIALQNTTWENGLFGGAVHFRGEGQGQSGGFNYINNAITVCAWVWHDAFPTDQVERYVTVDSEVAVIRRNNDGQLHFYIKTGGSLRHLGVIDVLRESQWHHVAGTWDGFTQRLYLDGVEIASRAPGGVLSDTSVAVKLSSSAEPLNGMLDDVRIYTRALTSRDIMILVDPTVAAKAFESVPADKATDVPRDVVLGWTPGEFSAPTNGHKLYFSESFNDVNDGIGAVAQTAAGYAPAQRLDFGTTYYWRVDEVNAPPTSQIEFKGEVWQFTTEPFSYPIAGENITATASSSGIDQGPENTVNGSGLDVNDLHSTELTYMWLSDFAGPQPTWIQYDFDKVYKLHEMWVWNHNTSFESFLGFGLKDASIEYSVDGNDYTTLGTVHEFAQGTGAADYEHNTTFDFGSAAAKYIMLTANSNWGGLMPQYGLSEVRFFSIPILAREPSPDSGTTDVAIGTIDEPVDMTLSFRVGREAAEHNVYFSPDEQAVADSNAPVTTVTEAVYGPLSLDLGTTYFWRVDEVNEAETPTTWQGDIWNFTTQKYFVVDDFEDYNDYEPYTIFDRWIDGWGVDTNGSEVGYAEPDFLAGEHFVETTIVHGGAQAMPFFYSNTGGAAYSEATFTLSSPQDWTKKGIEALSLRFRGNPADFVEGPAGTYTMSAAGVDIWDEADEFRYAHKQLSGDGEITATVESILWVPGSDDWTKAGVMIRETLDAGSKNAFVAITSGSGDGATFQWRSITGGSSSSSRTLVGISPPASIKLVRQGNTFTSYVFLDGQWQQEGESATVGMTDPVYIGLALNSHSSGVTTEAVFSDVQTTASGPFTQQAIGVEMPANDPAPMYVALAGSGGTPAIVFHDDPGATQVNTWTEWSINLQAFAAQGVNLTNIDSISIGFGDKANPQPGGTGVVYFDDIRLYPYRDVSP